MTVYFIRAGDDGACKIGYTGGSAASRLRYLQVGSSAKLTLLREIEGGVNIEHTLHQRYAHLRLSGEWFTFDESMLTDPAPQEVAPEPEERKPTLRELQQYWVLRMIMEMTPVQQQATETYLLSALAFREAMRQEPAESPA